MTFGYFTLDKSDQDRGLRWFTSRILGTLVKEREQRRDPYAMKRGYNVPVWLGGNRLDLPKRAASVPLIGGFLKRL